MVGAVFLFSLLHLPSRSHADLLYRGTPELSTREIDALLGASRALTPSEEEIRSRLPGLLDRYVTLGHLDVSVRLFREGADLVLEIDAGPRVVVSSRRIVGAPPPLDDELEASIGSEAGEVISIGRIRRDLERATRRLAEGGYPFASSRAEDFVRDGDRLAYRLRVEPGRAVAVDSLVVEGLGVTRPGTLRRIARFTRGRRFRESDLTEIRQRLERSGLFSRVDPVAFRFSPEGERGVYVIGVQEAPATSLSGVLGVGGRENELSGLVDVTLSNLFGTARSFRAHWEGRGEGRAYYEIAYGEPWIAGLPISLAGEFRQDQEDTLYTRTDWLLDVELEVFERLAVRGGWQTEKSVTPAGDPVRTDRRSTRFGLTYEGRDARFAPRRGMFVDLTGTRGTQKERGRDAALVRRRVITLDARSELHVPIAPRTGVAARLLGHVRAAPGERLRPEVLRALGGAGSVRGYAERRFRTGLGASATIELRRFLAPAGGARTHVFLDVAHFDPARTIGTDGTAWRGGVGVGVRVPTRVGLLGLDLAVSEEITSVEEMRLHLSVEGRY